MFCHICGCAIHRELRASGKNPKPMAARPVKPPKPPKDGGSGISMKDDRGEQ